MSGAGKTLVRDLLIVAPVFDGVVQGHVMIGEEGADLEPCVKNQQVTEVVLGELAVAIAFEGEGLECNPCGVFSGGGELLSEGVRDIDGDLHCVHDSIFGWAICVVESVGREPADSIDEAVKWYEEVGPGLKTISWCKDYGRQ